MQSHKAPALRLRQVARRHLGAGPEARLAPVAPLPRLAQRLRRRSVPRPALRARTSGTRPSPTRLHRVQGTGPESRIVERDILAALQQRDQLAVAAPATQYSVLSTQHFPPGLT